MRNICVTRHLSVDGYERGHNRSRTLRVHRAARDPTPTANADMDDDSREGQQRGDEAINDLVAARRARILGIPLGISFLAGVAATLLFPPPRLPAPMAQVLGMALVGYGLVIIVWAVTTMVRGGASPDASRPRAALVTWGPFRFSRNPMYLGSVLIYAGGGLLLNSLWIVLLATVVVAGITQAIIVRDEHLLEKRFGDEYRNYRAGVRRWL